MIRIGRVPCRNCPWRTSTAPSDIPGGGMDWGKAAEATGNRHQPDTRGSIMLCHREDTNEVCAGWATSEEASHSLPLRLAQINNQVTGEPDTDLDIDLHPNWSAMRAAHEDQP